MKKCFIILPNQLFNKKYMTQYKDSKIVIIEEPLFFGDKKRIKNFSKLKLVLHRSSMKYYFDYLKKNNFDVEYIDYNIMKDYNFIKKYQEVTIYDPADHLFLKRLNKVIKINKQKLEIIDSPLFLLSISDLEEYMKHKGNSNTFFHKHFYDWQLKKLNIPYISKSYDEMNRNKIPKNFDIPKPVISKNDNNSKYVKEGKEYVDKHFKNNYGDIDEFFYPVTHKTAKKWLKHFLKNRLSNFGNYQDAIIKDESFLFHSLLSSLINIGLLTPQQVVDETIKYYEKNKKEVQINNFEGFIRQVIGWREYERMLYQLYYDDLVNSNYFGNNNKLTKKWYTGDLGIEPIDNTIKRAFKTGYLHHIERLMVMLNFMVLARIRPIDIYTWFMEFACDSYDWVMIGNVYGMGYFNTNTMRKPYLSTSNYIRNMSNYENDGHWNETWDAMFYKFLTDNKSKLKGGAAFYLRNLAHFEKKSAKEKNDIFSKIKL
jgi:deoxyribodipyrimidine photolyase-related protein